MEVNDKLAIIGTAILFSIFFIGISPVFAMTETVDRTETLIDYQNGTFTLETHAPYTLNGSGDYVPYILSESPTEIHIITGTGSMNFNKDNCGFKLYKADGMSDVIVNNFTSDFYVDDVMQSPTCTVSSITEDEHFEELSFYFMNNDLKTMFNVTANGIEWTYQTENTSGGNQTYKIMEYCDDCDADMIDEDIVMIDDYVINLKNNTHGALMDITDTGSDVETHLEKEIADGEMLEIDPVYNQVQPTYYSVETAAPPCNGVTATTGVIGSSPSVVVGAFCRWFAAEWDISSIPTVATVTEARIREDPTFSPPTAMFCETHDVGTQPSSYTPSVANTNAMRTDWITGTLFSIIPTNHCDANIGINHAGAGHLFPANAETDLQNRITAGDGWWALGFHVAAVSPFLGIVSFSSMDLTVTYTVPFAPSEPENIVGQYTTANNINVDWDEPVNGTTIDYDILVKNLTAGDTEFTVLADNQVASVIDLYVPDQLSSLEFRIYGENATEHKGVNGTIVVPAKPLNLEVDVQVDQLQPMWDAVLNATKYQVFVEEEMSGSVFLANTTALTVIDTSITQGLNYTYKVRALFENFTGSDHVGIGFFSDEVEVTALEVIPPNEPTNLVLSGVTSEQIVLDWDAPINFGSSPITGYFIEKDQSCDNSFETLEGNTASTDTTYTALGLLEETCYAFRIKTITAVGLSADFSNVANTTTASSGGGGGGGGVPPPVIPPPASVGGGGGGGGSGSQDQQPINVANLRIFDHEDTAFLGQVDNDNRVRLEWTSGVNVDVTSIMPREPTPFDIMFQQTPIKLIANPMGITEAVIVYDIVVPEDQCQDVQTNDCAFLEEYIIPMVARFNHDGTEFTVNFNLIRNLSGDVEFVTIALAGIIGVPIIGLGIAAFLGSRKKKRKR